MDRRQFLRSSAALGATITVSGCASNANRVTSTIPAVSLDGDDIELPLAAVRELAGSLSGPLMLAEHPQYDTARTIWNGMHDRYPALIARCLNSADVSHAVSFARDNDVLDTAWLTSALFRQRAISAG